MRHGKGTFYKLDGDKYVGEWENDLRKGHGIYIWNKGGYYEVSQISVIDFFLTAAALLFVSKGEFLGNERHGHGVVHKLDGTTDEGTWYFGKFIY